MKKFRYHIFLLRNGKRYKRLHSTILKKTILKKWKIYENKTPPIFIKTNFGKKRIRLKNELILVYSKTKKSSDFLERDSLGRNISIRLDDENFYIKEKIPYWEEELVYDIEFKKRVKVETILNYLKQIKNIGLIYTLNNKLVIQIENNVKVYGNKNIEDARRLLEVIKTELIKENVLNFLFAKDISTEQRSGLYDLLVNKGYSRKNLFKHYSY